MALVIGNENYNWEELEASAEYKEGYTEARRPFPLNSAPWGHHFFTKKFAKKIVQNFIVLFSVKN